MNATTFDSATANVLDLSHFAIAFMNRGQYRGKQVLSQSAIARIARPVVRSTVARETTATECILANRAGRRPYAIADAALEAALPNVLEPAAPVPAAVAMDSSEMARYVGRYANGMPVEVAIDGGALVLRQGAMTLPIRKLAEWRFVAQGEEGGSLVAFVPGSDGHVKYLHLNMRAYRRM